MQRDAVVALAEPHTRAIGEQHLDLWCIGGGNVRLLQCLARWLEEQHLDHIVPPVLTGEHQ